MEFLNFKPGLVGGHCISVDPYYLTQIRDSWIFSSGYFIWQKINDEMPQFISAKCVKLILKGNKYSQFKSINFGCYI